MSISVGRGNKFQGTKHEDVVGARQLSFEVLQIQKRKTAIVEGEG
jgi:hypothetical protein